VKLGSGSPTEEQDRSLAINIFWLYALQGLNYLIPAAMLPYLVRVLGIEQYGLISFAQSIAQYFIIATDYGFNFSATRAIAQNRSDKNEVARVFWITMTIKMFLLVIGGLFLGAVVRASPLLHANMKIYFAAYVAVAGNVIFPMWLFQGLERMQSISVITGLAKLASALLVVIFVHSPQDTFLATLLLSSGFLIAGLVGMVVALRNHVTRFVAPTRRDILAVIRDGRHLFLTTAAVSLYTNTNTFLVGLIAGNVQAGYFSLADKLIRAITGLVGPIVQATYPHIIRLIAQSKEQAIAFVQKMLQRGAAVGLLMGISVLLLAKPLAHIAFSHSTPAAVPLLQVLSFFPLFCCLNFIFGTLVLIPFGFDKVQSQFLIVVGLINVVLGCALIPFYGALGGVLTLCTIEMVQTIGSTVIVHRGGLRIFRLAKGAANAVGSRIVPE
jgi:O-antigen/teichoic acid export membrane protein